MTGVFGGVGSGAVAARAQHSDDKAVGGTEHDARLGDELAMRFKGGEHVHTVGSICATTGRVQDAFLDHVTCAVEALFAGLEHEDDVARQLVAALGQQGGGAGQHGGVQVMATGVHGSIHAGGVVHAGGLLHRKSVHVGTQQHHGLLSRSVSRTAAQYRGDRRRLLAKGDLVRQSIQRLEYLLLRAGGSCKPISGSRWRSWRRRTMSSCSSLASAAMVMCSPGLPR